MTTKLPVVVGVDGSEDATHAVRWAAELAMRNGCDLVVLHAWTWPFITVPHGRGLDGPADGGMRKLAERFMREGMAAAREHCPTLEVTGDLATTSPAVALKVHSESASAIVIGSHGYGKVGTLLLGSVAIDLAGHTRCPLVVVRGTIDSHGPVVIGVDDSDRSLDAIEFAFAEAALRGAALRAVHAWHYPVIVPDWPSGVTSLLDEEEKHAREALEARLAPFRDRYPEVKVECLTPPGSPGRNLVEASVGAQLVVAGTRGRGGFRSLVLGSTSHALVHHAECPVAVVPHALDLEELDVDAGDEDDLPA